MGPKTGGLKGLLICLLRGEGAGGRHLGQVQLPLGSPGPSHGAWSWVPPPPRPLVGRNSSSWESVRNQRERSRWWEKKGAGKAPQAGPTTSRVAKPRALSPGPGSPPPGPLWGSIWCRRRFSHFERGPWAQNGFWGRRVAMGNRLVFSLVASATGEGDLSVP